MMKKTLVMCLAFCTVVALTGWFRPDLSDIGTASAAGKKYYVSPAGDDANNGRSPAKPWKTLHQAAGVLQAGDTLLLRGGEYRNAYFQPVNSGSAGKPITLEAYKDEVPVITGDPTDYAFIYIRNKSHFVFDGLHFENTTGGTPIFTEITDYLTIQNCVFRNNGGDTQVNLSGAYNVVQDSVFDTTGDPLGDGGQGAGDNIYMRGTSYSLIQNNSFTKGGHYAVDFINDYEAAAPGGKIFSKYNVVRNNYIDQGWGGGIGIVRGSTYTVVENNFIKNAGIGATYPKTGIQIAAEKNIVRNNIISKAGSAQKADEGMEISSYLFRDIPQNVTDNRIYNNVIWKAGRDAIFISPRDDTELTRNKIMNNIMYQNRVAGDYNEYWGTGNYYITVETWHAAANRKWPSYPNANFIYNNILLHADANNVDAPGYSRLFFYDQGDANPPCYACGGWAKSLAQVETDYPAYVYGNLEHNPGFADAEGDRFQLKADSAAIDAGAHLTQTAEPGSQTTTVKVDDARFFFDGFGIVEGDLVQIGGNQPVRVTRVDYDANTLTLALPVSFAGGANVDLPYEGSAPDLGAFEFGQPVAGGNRPN